MKYSRTKNHLNFDCRPFGVHHLADCLCPPPFLQAHARGARARKTGVARAARCSFGALEQTRGSSRLNNGSCNLFPFPQLGSARPSSTQPVRAWGACARGRTSLSATWQGRRHRATRRRPGERMEKVQTNECIISRLRQAASRVLNTMAARQFRALSSASLRRRRPEPREEE